MTRHQFIDNRTRYRNSAAIAALASTILFFAPVGFMAWLEPNRGQLPPHAWPALNIVAFCLIATAISFMWIRTMRLITRYGLRCPQCRKNLAGMTSLVIASGHCGHCGGLVLEDAS